MPSPCGPTFGTRDPDQISTVLAPDAEWLAPPDNATALAIVGGTSHMIGRDRIVRFLTQELTEARITCTLPRGGHYENDYCFIFEFSGGLLRRIREYMDTSHGAAQFAADAARSPGAT